MSTKSKKSANRVVVEAIARRRKLDPATVPANAYALYREGRKGWHDRAVLVVPFPALVRSADGAVDCDSAQASPQEHFRFYMVPMDRELWARLTAGTNRDADDDGRHG